MKKWLGLLIALAILYGAVELSKWRSTPLVLPDDGISYTLVPGDTVSSIAEDLSQSGILPRPWRLKLLARFGESGSRIRAGEYQVAHGTTPSQFLALLVSGSVIQYSVTFPEGFTLDQAVEKMAAEEKLDNTADIVRAALVEGYPNPEGWFFPDTYRYQVGVSNADILRTALEKMRRVLNDEWLGRDAGLPYQSPYEALIMASIIERETGRADERELIAGVFVRRLRLGMRLQTDPTIIYGVGSEFDGNLTRKHLRDGNNVYNTYRINGLPPTPIALPGRESIQAALHPRDSKDLYFVARGDGSHYFSKTLPEHEAAVRKYQLKRD
ncbi:MAG: UPF0755 protein [Halieaceae bacterium]|jgi:UPF0755 protein